MFKEDFKEDSKEDSVNISGGVQHLGVGNTNSISSENKNNAIKFANTFRSNLVKLLVHAKDLISKVNSHPDIMQGKITGTKLNSSLLGIAIAAAEAADKESMTRGFISRSETHWEKIARKDLDFLISNAEVLFEGAPTREINEFSRTFQIVDTKGIRILKNEQIETLWTMFGALVSVCVKHIHYGRDPIDGEYKNPTYFEDINLKAYQTLFNIKK